MSYEVSDCIAQYHQNTREATVNAIRNALFYPCDEETRDILEQAIHVLCILSDEDYLASWL